ncbi:hypothetical protein ABZ863_16915 [Saccharomonospora sp. NPDC046836]|uniref:hypothetical protein n=1 Tax=Saccharomonospora sp. NPDC046836 TaxID=3156921 RepID=UPI003408AEE5
MASLFSKVARFAASPQGRQLIAKAKRVATDPRTRRQAKDAMDKLRNRGKDNPPPAGS